MEENKRSGEQAEERTAKIATEIFEKVFGAPVVKARNGDDADAAESASVLTALIRHVYIEQMSDILKRELAECSRLASRVEELEEGMLLAAIRLKICAGRMRACNAENANYHELIAEVEDWQKEAEQLLAGAHAEDRE